MDPLSIGTGIAGTWLWEQFGKDFVGKLGGTAKDEWRKYGESQRWKAATEAYRAAILRQCGTIRLLGKSEPIPLEGIFSDVYVLDEVTARRRFNIEELKQHSAERGHHTSEETRRDGLTLVKEGKNLFILGKPGAGKTTFLKYISMQIIKGNFENVPIIVSLKEWADSESKDIKSFIVRLFSVCNFPNAQMFIDYLLENGRAIVMFDGLDEVLQEDNQRSKVTNLISEFSKQYYMSQILVTCRIAASEYTFENFQDIEIADFTEDQVRKFASKWFGHDTKKFEAFMRELGLPENRGIKDIASTPLLLTLLCLAFESNLSFPKRKAELYEDALDALLRRWDTSRNIIRDNNYYNLSVRLKQRMFAHIAAKTFEDGQYFIPQSALEQYIVDYTSNLPGRSEIEIDGTSILKTIESHHSIFVERSHRIYSFSHLTFQEYYTAKYIADNEARGTTNKLIENHLYDNRWREVLLLSSSLLDEADDYFVLMQNKLRDSVHSDVNILNLFNWANKKSTNGNKYIEYLYLFLETMGVAYLLRDAYFLENPCFNRAYISASNNKAGNDFVKTIFNVLNNDESQQMRPISVSVRNHDMYSNVNGFVDIIATIGSRNPVIGNNAVLNREMRLKLASVLSHDNLVDFMLIVAMKSITTVEVASLWGKELKIAPDYHYLRKFINNMNKYASKNRVVFAQELQDLIPPANKDADQWNEFGGKLSDFARKERDIGKNWNISQSSVETLINYMRAFRLMIECLEVAGYMSRGRSVDHLFLGT